MMRGARGVLLAGFLGVASALGAGEASSLSGAERREVEAAIERLGDPSDKVVSQARGELIVWGQRAVPLLTGRLDDPRPAIRLSVAEVLGRLGRLASVPDLVNLLENERPRVRQSAIVALLGRHPEGAAYGYQPDGPAGARAAAVARWRAWATGGPVPPALVEAPTGESPPPAAVPAPPVTPVAEQPVPAPAPVSPQVAETSPSPSAPGTTDPSAAPSPVAPPVAPPSPPPPSPTVEAPPAAPPAEVPPAVPAPASPLAPAGTAQASPAAATPPEPASVPTVPPSGPAPAAAAPPVASADPSTPQARLAQADAALAAGRWSEAATIYGELEDLEGGGDTRDVRRRAREGRSAAWDGLLAQADADRDAGLTERALAAYRQAEESGATRGQRRHGARGVRSIEEMGEAPATQTAAGAKLRDGVARYDAGDMDGALALLDEALAAGPTEAEERCANDYRRRVADRRAEARMAEMLATPGAGPTVEAPASPPVVREVPAGVLPDLTAPHRPASVPEAQPTRPRPARERPLAQEDPALREAMADEADERARTPSWMEARVKRALHRIHQGNLAVAVHERRVLAALGPSGIAVLSQAYTPATWPSGRAAILYALGEIADAGGLPVLQVGMQDPDAGVRREAATAMAKVGDPAAAETLVPLLDDPRAEVRAAAAVGIGRLKMVGAREPLEARLGDPSPYVRQAVARALGQIGDTEAIPALLARFEDPDPYARSAVGEALDALGSRERDFYARDLPPQQRRGADRWRQDVAETDGASGAGS